MLAILFIVWMTYLLVSDEQAIVIIKSVSLFDLTGSVVISLVMFLISGYQMYYLLRKTSDTNMNKADIILLPASMNLWSYLLPFRGGLIYSAFYIKLKYQVELAKGFSIGIFTFILSTALAGIFGIYISIISGKFFTWLGSISVILTISPLILILMKKILASITFNRNTLYGKSMEFLKRTISGFGLMMGNLTSTVFILFLVLLSILIYILWVYWSVKSFGFAMSFSSIIILALVLRLSVIARFIPGNVGIQELISGATTTMMGGSIQEGILIALFIRLTALVIAIVLGIYSLIKNIDIFKSESLYKLWSDFKTS